MKKRSPLTSGTSLTRLFDAAFEAGFRSIGETPSRPPRSESRRTPRQGWGLPIARARRLAAGNLC